MDNVIVVQQEGRSPLHVIVEDVLDIGRECDGLLVVDERVSRRHLQIRNEFGRLMVTDLGSSNGTFLDGKRIVRPADSLTWTRRLVSEAGIFAGISSGAALAGAVKVAKRIPEGDEAAIVFVVCDGAWKYLSTGAYTDPLDEVVDRLDDVIYF